MKQQYLLILLAFFTIASFGQQKLWTKSKLKKSNASTNLYARKSMPTTKASFNLNFSGMKEILNLSENEQTLIQIPFDNGETSTFSIKEAAVLAPELAAKYPGIKSFAGTSVDDATVTTRFSIGTDGFHGVIYSTKGNTIYIDPLTTDNSEYIVYRKSAQQEITSDFQCLVENKATDVLHKKGLFLNTPMDGKLRTFRLALGCTGEYSDFHLANQNIASSATDAVKKAAILSAMNTTMSRVNGVFERDLSLRMVIIPNNENIIFLDKNTDNLTDNDPEALIEEIQTICDNTIGNANYDIGHVFSTEGGGLAGGGVVCITGQKAAGVTGSTSPIGDSYDIDYVAHEIGHQFGANHTQNNDCNRVSSVSVEPGSASTIMGYAGICPPNIQSNSDDHFHAVSITEMWNTIQATATCGAETSTGNAAPVANAGLDYTIPKSTPFILKGSATDADTASGLTYNWEQIDPEIGAAMPPASTNPAGPMFRSHPSTTSPNRYIPALSTIVSGNISTTWEVLPSVARDLNFTLTVRDNNAGGGAVSRDDVKISTVVTTGSFEVTSQNTSTTWNVGDTETIIWVVASTNTGAINCQKVNIKLSADGGVTFPTTLLANTDNDGTATITVPNIDTNTARIVVEAADNIFYQVNTGVINIDGATASITDVDFNNFKLFPNPSNGKLTVDFSLSNSDDITIQLVDLSGRIVEKKKYSNVASRFSEELSFESVSKGFYLLKVTNGSSAITKKVVLK